MTTDENTRSLTGLFATPVASAEPAADAPPASTPGPPPRRPGRRTQAPRRGSRRSRLIAAAAIALALLLVGLGVAGHAPKRVPAPPAGPARPTPITHPTRSHARVDVHKRARDARAPHRVHERRHHRHVRRAHARAIAPPVVVTAPRAPTPVVPVAPTLSWRAAPAPAPSDEPEFF